jgi:hypothetical protein
MDPGRFLLATAVEWKGKSFPISGQIKPAKDRECHIGNNDSKEGMPAESFNAKNRQKN